MSNIGRLFIVAGLALVVVGLVVSLLGSGLPFGRLPGDLRFTVGGTRVFVPVVSCLALSVVLTVLVNIVLRIFAR